MQSLQILKISGDLEVQCRVFEWLSVGWVALRSMTNQECFRVFTGSVRSGLRIKFRGRGKIWSCASIRALFSNQFLAILHHHQIEYTNLPCPKLHRHSLQTEYLHVFGVDGADTHQCSAAGSRYLRNHETVAVFCTLLLHHENLLVGLHF